MLHLGFNWKRLTFRTAPSGRGDAKRWVRSQYPEEVALLRRRNYQRGLFLIAVCDGDNVGLAARKADLDGTLPGPRGEEERIAKPVPTWSIETWLLALLGQETTDENETRKHEFERQYPKGEAETRALVEASEAWRARADQIPSVPSLADSKTEMRRINP